LKFHRGRLIDHVLIVSKDLDASREFYEAVLGVLGVEIEREGEGWFMADELFVQDGKGRKGKIHLALQAPSEDAVKEFFDVGLDAGGKKKSAPAYDKDIHPYYYSASLTDPDGHIIEVVSHGPITRSADSVVVKPSAMALLNRIL
jgi:catechol 2,3-dioxygenase-like lactoylglutathione lyase family enzyme